MRADEEPCCTADNTTYKVDAKLNAASDYQNLVSKLQQLFPDLSSKNFTIHCSGAGGDSIVAATENDIYVALGSLPQGAPLKIVIEEKKQQPPPLHNLTREKNAECSSCGEVIYGHWYECTVCSNFYQCATCEQRGRHAHHPVIRITTEMPKAPGTRPRLWDLGYHRQSHLFPDLDYRHGGASGNDGRYFSSGLFQCFNQPAFQEFHDMATNLTRTWCMSMPPPTRTSGTNSTKGNNSKKGPQHSKANGHHQHPHKEDDLSSYHGFTRSQTFDQGLYNQMVDEMTEKMNSTLDSIGTKHHQKPRSTTDRTCTRSSSVDSAGGFERITEVVSPMWQDLMGAVGGHGQAVAHATCSGYQTKTETNTDTDLSMCGEKQKPSNDKCKETSVPGQTVAHNKTGDNSVGSDEVPCQKSESKPTDVALSESFKESTKIPEEKIERILPASECSSKERYEKLPNGIYNKFTIANRKWCIPQRVKVTASQEIGSHTVEPVSKSDTDTVAANVNKEEVPPNTSAVHTITCTSKDIPPPAATEACCATTKPVTKIPSAIAPQEKGSQFRQQNPGRRSQIPQLSKSSNSPPERRSPTRTISDNRLSSPKRKAYFDPRGGLGSQNSTIRLHCPSKKSDEQQLCQCGKPSDPKLMHGLISCVEPSPGPSRMSDTSDTGSEDTDIQSDTDGESNNEELTRALDQLETMGFADVGGSLSTLLIEEGYDVWRVLERIISDTS